jgi:hypothetical protein
MRFQVQKHQCDSCIYRPQSSLDIAKLEAQIADPYMTGFFTGYRECHHAKRGSGVCCAGFWKRHSDSFTAGQLAQRLGYVEFVAVDTLST